jgi:hypothetical protein
MAICGIRFGMFSFNSSTLASDLVANYMAICVSISSLRNDLMICYPPEPILAEAASDLCVPRIAESLNLLHYVNILDDLKTAMSLGTVNAGDRGELIARIILLIARDISHFYAHKEAFFSEPVTLQQFLEALLESVPALGVLAEAFVSFTHFGLCEYDPCSQKTLKDFYRNRTAIITKKNFAAVDLMIPLLLADQSYGVVRIQIKNRERSQASKVKKDLSKTSNPQELGIYFQLNGKNLLRNRDEVQEETANKDDCKIHLSERSINQVSIDESRKEHHASGSPIKKQKVVAMGADAPNIFPADHAFIEINGLADLNREISSLYEFRDLLKENYSMRDWAAEYSRENFFVDSVGKYIFDRKYHACKCGDSSITTQDELGNKVRGASKGKCKDCKCAKLGKYCPDNCKAPLCSNKKQAN